MASDVDSRPKGRTIEDILSKLNARQLDTVNRLRGLVKTVVPDAVETSKWGNITYLLDGRNLAWIVCYRDHADLGFFRGAELKSSRLEGSGKGLRHVKVRTTDDIDESEFGRLLHDAVKLA
jgi:hypothetical protein